MPNGYFMISPAMIRTGYHLHSPAPLPEVDPALRPHRDTARDRGASNDAFADWLAHLDAGRIEVR